jgi:Uma2 family endonuclease
MPATAAAKPRSDADDHRPTDAERMDADGRQVSEADYWAYYYEFSDAHYEWNNGRLEEKPVSDNLTIWIYHWLQLLLDRFLTTRPIAKYTGLEFGFRLALPDRVVIRKPDLAVVRDDNPVPLGELDCSYRGVFDLCIEALSDRDRAAIERDVVEKRRDYDEIGVREYHIVHHDPDRLRFWSRGPDGSLQSILGHDGIVRSRALPGFNFRIRDLLGRTAIDDLRHDPIYQPFVHPGWQQAEQAQRQAEQALHEAERQRDAAIVKLHALGLDPEQIAASLSINLERVRARIGGG